MNQGKAQELPILKIYIFHSTCSHAKLCVGVRLPINVFILFYFEVYGEWWKPPHCTIAFWQRDSSAVRMHYSMLQVLIEWTFSNILVQQKSIIRWTSVGQKWIEIWSQQNLLNFDPSSFPLPVQWTAVPSRSMQPSLFRHYPRSTSTFWTEMLAHR